MKALKWLDNNLEEFLLMFLLSVMAIIMGVQVCMRYLFNASLSWSEELTRYLFVWSGFVSISYCIKKQYAIKIEQFTNMMSDKVRNKLVMVIRALTLVFMVFMFIKSVAVIQGTIASGQKSPALQLPMYYVHLSAVLGFLLASIRAAEDLVFPNREIATRTLVDTEEA